jgi:hypothetical protein
MQMVSHSKKKRIHLEGKQEKQITKKAIDLKFKQYLGLKNRSKIDYFRLYIEWQFFRFPTKPQICCSKSLATVFSSPKSPFI